MRLPCLGRSFLRREIPRCGGAARDENARGECESSGGANDAAVVRAAVSALLQGNEGRGGARRGRDVSCGAGMRGVSEEVKLGHMVLPTSWLP